MEFGFTDMVLIQMYSGWRPQELAILQVALAVKFNAAGQFFVGFNAHDSKINLSIFRNENWFRIIMAKCGNFIVMIL